MVYDVTLSKYPNFDTLTLNKPRKRIVWHLKTHGRIPIKSLLVESFYTERSTLEEALRHLRHHGLINWSDGWVSLTENGEIICYCLIGQAGMIF